VSGTDLGSPGKPTFTMIDRFLLRYRANERERAARVMPHLRPHRGSIAVGGSGINLNPADRGLGMLHSILGEHNEAGRRITRPHGSHSPTLTGSPPTSASSRS
jgi:hypothetical protein